MKVQVPGEEEFKERYRLSTEWCDDHPVLFEIRYRMFCDGIAYTNEQLATNPPNKRPFLSDGEIDEERDTYTSRDACIGFTCGARWARDKYEAAFVADVPAVEPKWQPLFGMKCAFWNTGEAYTRTDLWVGYSSDFVTGMKVHKGQNHNHGQYCALIETLDEIGKPPSYFQERGRCTV